ncbi:MAG: metallophosphoesterase [Luteimonas sp.]|nr:metallophosphoesterase [Luteimonas sp.]
MSVVLYCGDPHSEFRHIVRAAEQLDASAVVLLGDLEPMRPLHEELASIASKVWFIHGNHDTDSDANWSNVWESRLADRNIHGRVVTLPDGTRLAGLGGVFRESAWYPTLSTPPRFRTPSEHDAATARWDGWRGGRARKHWSSIYPEELDRLANLRADVLITHEAPGYHRHGSEILDTLAQSMGVKVTVHAHHHDRLDSSGRWSRQGFKSHGVGLRGITAIDGEGNASVIVSGELDVQRNHRQRYIDL